MSVPVTGCAVDLSYYISHNAKHRKMANFDPHGAKTHQPISIKLGMVDHVPDTIPHDNFGGLYGQHTQFILGSLEIP